MASLQRRSRIPGPGRADLEDDPPPLLTWVPAGTTRAELARVRPLRVDDGLGLGEDDGGLLFRLGFTENNGTGS